MSKLDRREFKSLLLEWKQNFLNEKGEYLKYNKDKEILCEVSIKKFQKLNPDFDISSFNSRLKGNTDYLDIITNTINSGEQHGPDDYTQQFEFYKNLIEPNRQRQEFLTINIPGGETVSLVDKLNPGSCTATYNDIQQFQQARMFVLGKASKNKLAAAYEKVINEANESDFELIANNSDWIIFYPKSIKGSIALARSYWDGSKLVYDKTFNPSKGYGQKIGYMNWCTSVSGQGNMFLNYHRNLNLHMYYCIKKNLNSVSNPNRKLCVSLTKNEGEVSYMTGHSSVNGDNSAVSEQNAKNYLGNMYNILEEDAKQDKRLEIDLETYYKSINVRQYVTMRNANEENIEDFINEFDQILYCSRESDKISIIAAKDPNKYIREIVANSRNSSVKTLELLANDSSESVRAIVARHPNASLETLELLANDSSERLRAGVARNPNASSEILSLLANDSSESVRALVARNPNASLEILELLANDSSVHTKVNIAENPATSLEILALLANDSSESVRAIVGRNPNTSLEILELLANDSSKTVRAGVRRNPNASSEILSLIESKKSIRFRRLEEDLRKYIQSILT